MSLNSCRIVLQQTAVESLTVGATSITMNSPPTATKAFTFTDGTGANQSKVIASITGSVTHGTPASIDLSNLTNASAATPLSLLSVRSIMVQDVTAPAVSGNNLQVGDTNGNITNEWVAPWLNASGGDTIDAGGAILKVAPTLGYTVDGTHKVLTLNASNGTIAYQIDIIGTA